MIELQDWKIWDILLEEILFVLPAAKKGKSV